MLLGIYDDLLFGSASITRAKQLLIGGLPQIWGAVSPIISSRDGVSFATSTLPFGGQVGSVAFGNDMVMALALSPFQLGTVKAATSKDSAQTWTLGSAPFPGVAANSAAIGLAFGRGIFVAVGNNSSGYATIATTPDGQTWTPRTLPWTGSISQRSVQFLNGVFFICGYDSVGQRPVYATSADGISFVRRADIWPSGRAPIFCASYANGYWMLGGVGSGGQAEVAFSSDLSNWTRAALPWPATTSAFAYIADIFYFKGRFYAGGCTASSPYIAFASSPDLVTWTNQSCGATQGTVTCLCAMPDRLVAVVQTAYPNALDITTGGAPQPPGFVYYGTDTPDGIGGQIASYPSTGKLSAYMFTTDGSTFSNIAVPANVLFSASFASFI